jgi:hypothetical protein
MTQGHRIQFKHGVFFIVLTGTLTVGCNARVLSFVSSDAGGAASTGNTGEPTGASGVDPTARIQDLTDAQALQLCTWLAESGPVKATQGAPLYPGFVDGASYGCTNVNGGEVARVVLIPSDCVANLRHTPCPSTVGSLETCVAHFDDNYTTFSCAASAIDAACGAYESNASCSETVLQAPRPSNGTFCSGQLPIVEGATCPPDDDASDGSPADAGTD